MNSAYLQDYQSSLTRLAGASEFTNDLLARSFRCFVTLVARAVNGIALPEEDLLQLTVQLLLLSDGLARLGHDDDDTRAAHYLVGLGFEQSSELLSRVSFPLDEPIPDSPFTDDIWYRLTLSFLHYSVAGYRIQARTVAARLEQIASSRPLQNTNAREGYDEAINEIRNLRDALPSSDSVAQSNNLSWQFIFHGDRELPSRHLLKFRLLARQIRQRRLELLDRLGYQSEETENWLRSRQIEPSTNAIQFWQQYLNNLKARGFTAFTSAQAGPRFDKWLRPDVN